MGKVTTAAAATDAGLHGESFSQDLAELVSGMSRFLTTLTGVPPFADARLGLAEWSVLNTVAKNPTVRQKQVAGSLGISGQRVSQIVDSLLKAGLVSVTASQEDSRQKIIATTDAGATKLAEVNAALDAMLAVPLKNKERVLASASRIVNRHLLRALRTPKSEAEIPEKDTKADKGKMTKA